MKKKACLFCINKEICIIYKNLDENFKYFLQITKNEYESLELMENILYTVANACNKYVDQENIGV